MTISSATALSLIASVLVCGCRASNVAGPAVPAATTLPPNYTLEYDSLFQTPRHVWNLDAVGGARPGAPAPFSDAEAFQIVRRFVIRYGAVFRLRPNTDDFVAIWAQGRDGANFVKIQQTYRGVPVDIMGYGTMVLGDGSVGSMIGRFMPDLRLSTVPSVGPATATAAAIEALAPTVVQATSAPTLSIAILTDDSRPRLAWSVIVVQDGGFFSWTVVVDARDAAVLRVAQNWITD